MGEFVKFIEIIQKILQNYKINQDDIDYVNITDEYWIPSNLFFTMKYPPKVWPHFGKNCLGTWDVPSDFKIVMHDHRWFRILYKLGRRIL